MCKYFQNATGLLLIVLSGLLFMTVVISTGSGQLSIAFGDVIRIILAKLPGLQHIGTHVDELTAVIVTDVRLPRIVTAALVGGGLAVCGAVFQGILLNPLADPYTLGVSAGAAFGASVALLINFSMLGTWSVPVFAFCGAVLTLAAVIYLTVSSGDFSSGHLILSGIIVAAILSAAVSFIKYLADEQVGIIIFWLMGSFASKTWAEAGLTATTLAGGLAVFIFFGRDLNLLALGSRTAGSLGVPPRKIAMILLVAASLVSAACVSVSGIIGFVGLLVPHMVRMVTGPDNRRLIPVSTLAGACLLLGADTVTRTVLPMEVPIGVITALIGGPFFCVIYRKHQKQIFG